MESESSGGTLAGCFFDIPGRTRQLADKRALELIGIVFGTLTLMVISTGAAVVAGSAASSPDAGYLESAYARD